MSHQKFVWALNRLSGFGVQKFKELHRRIPHLQQWEEAELSGVLQNFIGRDAFIELNRILSSSDFEHEIDECQSRQIQLLTILDPDYPKNLFSIYDPPLVLYVKGNLISADEFAVAVVGSRRPSLYGLRMADRFSRELAERGITIVSGFACGIDGEAHKAALRVKGRTLAVLGCGVDVLYPKEHGKLYDEIAEAGALISEFPLGTVPQSFHFPKRNRIISGLALGVLVIEAGQRSGSLITASIAAEEGREVYAVPGPLDSFTSQGTNHLIQSGAKLVTTAEDIFMDLKDQMKAILNCSVSIQKAAPPTDEVNPLLKLLSKQPLSFDEIMVALGENRKGIYSQLIELELKGKIKRVFGGKFSRTQELAIT